MGHIQLLPLEARYGFFPVGRLDSKNREKKANYIFGLALPQRCFPFLWLQTQKNLAQRIMKRQSVLPLHFIMKLFYKLPTKIFSCFWLKPNLQLYRKDYPNPAQPKK